MNRYLLLIIVLLLLNCSSKSFEDTGEMWVYLRDADHGYLHEKSVNGYDFSLLYKPTDLLVYQELAEEDKNDSKRVQKLRNKYNQYMYFVLSMSRGNKELLSTAPKNRQEFGSMVNELAFGMRKKVCVFTQKKDTLELVDYIYPRMYGMSRATTMLFVYPRDRKYLKGEYLNMTIGDLGIYTGEVRFKIPIKKIQNEPKLKL